MTVGVGRDEVWSLLVGRVASVCAVAPDTLEATTRFEADLGADSLDMVEVIEGIERDLAGRGIVVLLADDVVMGMETLGDAADTIAASARAR